MLTDQQVMIRDVARDFGRREITPFAKEWDQRESLDPSIVSRLAAIGFLGATIPPEYGGQGLDSLSYCLVIEELGRADSSVRGIVSVSLGLVAETILKWGSAAQREKWLPQLNSGEVVGCFGLTEPGNGSDAANIQTRAVKDGSGWRLSGQKIFITNGTWARLAIIFARTGEPGPRGITAFVLSLPTYGFQAVPIKGKLGLRAQDTASLYLDNVLVDDDCRLGAVGEGFQVAMSALDTGRMSLAAGSVGVAQAALDAAIAYAGERRQFGRSISSFQLIQELLADSYVEVEAARLMTWRVAEMEDAGLAHSVESSAAKYYASEVAVRVSNAAVQVFGGYGYIEENPVAKCLRDARVLTLYEGTSQMHKLLIGRALTGRNAFS
jgi:alkylation response protein AidB-like acyl-CoA dehydrogenase